MLRISQTHDVWLTSFLILKEWRILNIENLQQLEIFPTNKASLRRIILRLEKKKLLESFCDPETRKKYIFLSKKGERALGIKNYPPALTRRCLRHDAKAVELALKFYDHDFQCDVQLEHKIADRSKFKVYNHNLPDFVLHYKNEDRPSVTIASELEISRKRKSAISDKLKQYLDSAIYDKVLYLVPHIGVLNLIKRLLKQHLNGRSTDKFIFAHHPKMLAKDYLKLEDYKWSYLDRKVSFKEVMDTFTQEAPEQTMHTECTDTVQADFIAPQNTSKGPKTRAFWPFRN